VTEVSPERDYMAKEEEKTRRSGLGRTSIQHTIIII